jgi:hypothetical protein
MTGFGREMEIIRRTPRATSFLLLLLLLLSAPCNAKGDADLYSEEGLKSDLSGGWAISSYCRILERTKSPLAAREAFNDYHEIVYAPDRKFSFNQTDSSYWIFLDSAQGIRSSGFPIKFDLRKPAIIVLSENHRDTLAVIKPNYLMNADRLLLIKPGGDSLIFNRVSKQFYWGSPTARYTNRVVLSGIFFPILNGIVDTAAPIGFSEAGVSSGFSKLVGSPRQTRFNIVHRFTKKDSSDYISIRNPESKIGRVFECKFGNDTLIFMDTQRNGKSGRNTFILVRDVRRSGGP